jgi:hypothetical protein
MRRSWKEVTGLARNCPLSQSLEMRTPSKELSMSTITRLGRSTLSRISIDDAKNETIPAVRSFSFQLQKTPSLSISFQRIQHFFSTDARTDVQQEVQQDDLSIREYQNLWSNPPFNDDDESDSDPYHLQPLNNDRRLDRQSRFVLELLQTMYQVGLTKTVDRVTTDRCNAIIQRLMGENQDHDNNKHSNDPNFIVWPEEYDVESNHKQSANKDAPVDSNIISRSYWCRCERARAILESMELFQPLQDNNSGKLPIALPVPNHETYFQVLRMYASKQLADGGHDRNSLQRAPLIARSIVTRMEQTQKLALQPSSMHWNQVLSAYANSQRPYRPLEAATLLYELDTKNLTDESSFSHVLRCCVELDHGMRLHRTSKYIQKQHEKFIEISLAVSQRVWNGLTQHHQKAERRASESSRDHLSDLLVDSRHKKDGIQFQSHHFVHMLRVARNFADLSMDDGSITEKQASWVKKYLSECIQYQKVNIHVLLEVIHQAKEMATRQHPQDKHNEMSELDWIANLLPGGDGDPTSQNLERFKGKRKQADSRSPGRIAKEMLRSCPPAWTAKAD